MGVKACFLALALALALAMLQQGCSAVKAGQGCRSPDKVRIAEEALTQINLDRRDGYIFIFNSLYDFSQTSDQEGGGSLYNMTIDVLESKCHVISRKPWKECRIRDIANLPVYGECEVSVSDGARVELRSYTCAIRKVPGSALIRVCPDCPSSIKVDEPLVVETAVLSLKSFNAQSQHANLFTLGDITKASLQWMIGPAYFVEFTIHETVCTKQNITDDPSKCPLMEYQSARRGICSGSHITMESDYALFVPSSEVYAQEKQHPVEVQCELYGPEAISVQNPHHATAVNGHEHQDPRQHLSLGAVVDRPAPSRSFPKARSCPGLRRHNLLSKLRL